MRTTRGAVALSAVLLPLVLVSGCGGSAGTSSTAASSDRAAVSTTDSTSEPTTEAPAETPTPTPTATATVTATATAPASPSASPTAAAAAPRWAKALGEPQQGDPVWGVYLAVGHSATDAEVEDAVHDAAKVGYQAVVGDIACDGGAMDALALDQYDYWSGATLYFATEADARGFAAAYTRAVRPPVGIAHVTVGCLD